MLTYATSAMAGSAGVVRAADGEGPGAKLCGDVTVVRHNDVGVWSGMREGTR
jgi:hypothetical protein